MIIVNVTDAKPQYLLSAINICSLPEGATSTLTYKTKWVDESVLSLVKKPTEFPEFTLFYLSGNRVEDIPLGGKHLDSAKFVPMRKASVLKAKIEGDYVMIDVRLGKFISGNAILACLNSKGMHNKLLENPKAGKYVYEVDDRFVCLEVATKSTSEAWQDVVKALLDMPNLSNANFCFLEKVTDVNSGREVLLAEGVYRLRSSCNYSVLVHSLAKGRVVEPPPTAQITLAPQLGVITDLPDIEIGRDYVQREIRFGAAASGSKVEGQVLIRSNVSLTSNISIRVEVRGRRVVAFLKRSSVAVGGVFTGSVGLLSESVSVYAKIAVLAVGAIVLAIGSSGRK